MTTMTTACAVTLTSDGQRQIIPFETEDGTAIPHDAPEEVIVSVNGADLKPTEDYTITHHDGRSVVTLLKAPQAGSEIEISRHTHLIQPKKFRRSGDWDIKLIEEGLDRVTRGVIDALWRIAKIEKVVHVEHRVVDVPAHVAAPTVADVKGLSEELQRLRESSVQQAPANLAEVAETIANVVLSEVRQITHAQSHDVARLASEVARLQSQMTALYHEVGRS